MVSYLMQWAAVRTQLLATRVPPQVWDHFPKDWYCRETCRGRGAQAHGWEGTGGRQGGQGTSLRPVFLPKPRAPNPPAFTSWVLGLQVCVSKPSYCRSILMLYRKKIAQNCGCSCLSSQLWGCVGRRIKDNLGSVPSSRTIWIT